MRVLMHSVNVVLSADFCYLTIYLILDSGLENNPTTTRELLPHENPLCRIVFLFYGLTLKPVLHVRQ
jgi:hypothetical protein